MNKKRILIILILTFFLTGCVKYEIEMGVNTDKSFTLTIINAIQNEYAGTSDGEADFSKYQELGYEVEKYTDSTHSGLKLTKKFKSIDDISSNNYGTFELTSLLELKTTDFKLFKSEKKDNVTTYTANFTYDLTAEKTGEDAIDYSEYSDTMVFIYQISIPSNVTLISNNATSNEIINDIKVLTWNIKYGELKNINFVFSIDDNNLKEVENNNINNNTNNPDNNTNDNNNITNDQNENLEIEEQEKTETVYVENKGNIVGSIIAALFAVAMVIGIIVYKIKIKKDSITPNTAMTHLTPPKR